MTRIHMSLVAALLVAPLSLSAQDAAPAAPAGESLTCAAYLEEDDIGREEAFKELAAAIGMDAAAADDAVTAERLGEMATVCETDPAMAAGVAFQNAIENAPG